MTVLDPHLDAYQLSAAVDGEADATVAGHLAGCPTCRGEVASWKHRLGTLATPVAGGSADDAIAAALEAIEPAGAVVPRRRLAGAPARVVKIAAAVAIVAVVASGLLVGLRHHPSGTAAADHSAASRLNRASVAEPAAGAPAIAGAGSSAEGLGSVSSPAALVGDLRSRLPSKAAAALVPSTARCLASAERLDGSPAHPGFEASLRFEGHAGEVFVFRDAGRYVAWVLATDCSSLTSVRFS